MPRKKVHVCFLLDESGSMSDFFDETIEGFNQYVENLKKDKGDRVYFTFTKFTTDNSGQPRLTIKNLINPIDKVGKLNDFNPTGGTPLLDAMGKTIEEIQKYSASKEEILFVVMTDGGENASRHYDHDSIKKLMAEKKAEGWSFAFLGMGDQAKREAENIGMGKENAVSFTPANFEGTFLALAEATNKFRDDNQAGLPKQPLVKLIEQAKRGK